jgi:hypothetical protein
LDHTHRQHVAHLGAVVRREEMAHLEAVAHREVVVHLEEVVRRKGAVCWKVVRWKKANYEKCWEAKGEKAWYM